MSVYVTASLLLFNLFGSCVVASTATVVGIMGVVDWINVGVADGCRVVVEGVAWM